MLGPYIVFDHRALPSDEQDESACRDIDWLPAIAKRPNRAVTASTLPWRAGVDLEWIMGRDLNEWIGWQPETGARTHDTGTLIA